MDTNMFTDVTSSFTVERPTAVVAQPHSPTGSRARRLSATLREWFVGFSPAGSVNLGTPASSLQVDASLVWEEPPRDATGPPRE